MPSKSNERFLRADRRNQIEKGRLEKVLKLYEKEKLHKALEIDREKKEFFKSLSTVRRTSGVSDQGVAPTGKSDNDYLSAPVYRMGIRLSERRLMGWRAQEKEEIKRRLRSARSSSHRSSSGEYRRQESHHDNDIPEYDENGNVDDVFSENESVQELEFDPNRLTRCIMESYKSLFSQKDFKLDKENVKRIRSAKFCRSISDIEIDGQGRPPKQRPQTAVSFARGTRGLSLPLPKRPSTAVTYGSTKNNLDNGSTISKSPHSKFNNYLSSSDIDSEGTDDVDSMDLSSSQSETNMKHSSKQTKDNMMNGMKEDGLSESGSAVQTHRKHQHRVSISRLNDRSNAEPIPEDGILTTTYKNKTRRASESSIVEKPSRCKSAKNRRNSATVSMQSIHENGEQTNISNSDINTSDSESDISFPRRPRISTSRQRHSSGSTMTSDSRDFLESSVFSSMSDLSLDSNGQRKPSKWREFVCAEKAQIPPPKNVVSVTTVLRAALAFSKTARKRALTQLVQEQNTDAGEIIRQERLRRLDSKNNILAAISKNFAISINNMNQGKSTEMQ